MPPAKVIKTERTHEENQERAYIAASRRSDRSLEARVESARRASEIHKRRTGRSLRVTEEDVQNEEMYEEEDDDLPLQYRRLTAHLQTGSADFNRRLSAYLTNHVAMRTALQQSIDNCYAQQYPNAPQFANQQSMFPSPMLAHQGQQQMMQPPYSPSTYRTAPYQSLRPQQQNFQPSPHHRSASIAIPHELPSTSRSTPVVNSDNGRRMSMPTAPSTASPVEARTPLSASSATPQSRPSFPPGSFSQSQLQQFALSSYDIGAFGHTRFSPFSTALPADTQGLLGSTLDYNDPLTSVMMAGNSNLPGNFYDFSNQSLPQTTSVGKHQVHPSFDGLYSTLAPSALELSQANDAQNQSFFENAMKDGSQGITPAGTPGVNGESWGNFIDDSAWDIP